MDYPLLSELRRSLWVARFVPHKSTRLTGRPFFVDYLWWNIVVKIGLFICTNDDLYVRTNV